MATMTKPVATKAAENVEELKTIVAALAGDRGGEHRQTTAIIAKTHNPLIQLVMEIIRQDSAMHKRVQQVDSGQPGKTGIQSDSGRVGRSLGS